MMHFTGNLKGPMWGPQVIRIITLNQQDAPFNPPEVRYSCVIVGAGPDVPPMYVLPGDKSLGLCEFGSLQCDGRVYRVRPETMAGEALGEWLDCDTGAVPVTEGWRHLEFIATWTQDPDPVVPPAPAWFLISADHAEELRQHLATVLYILDTGLNTTTCIPADFQ